MQKNNSEYPLLLLGGAVLSRTFKPYLSTRLFVSDNLFALALRYSQLAI